jgi:hypothetical protein
MAKRYPTRELAHIEVYGRAESATVLMKNLSATGAYLEWEKSLLDFKVGDLIRMRIHLNSLNRSHSISAEIRWISENPEDQKGVGVQFIRSDEVISKLISRL